MVFVLSVCMCVCLWLFLRYRLRGGSWAISIASVPQTHKIKWRFCQNDGIQDRETGIIMDRVARSNLSISDTCMRITWLGYLFDLVGVYRLQGGLWTISNSFSMTSYFPEITALLRYGVKHEWKANMQMSNGFLGIADMFNARGIHELCQMMSDQVRIGRNSADSLMMLLTSQLLMRPCHLVWAFNVDAHVHLYRRALRRLQQLRLCHHQTLCSWWHYGCACASLSVLMHGYWPLMHQSQALCIGNFSKAVPKVMFGQFSLQISESMVEPNYPS